MNNVEENDQKILEQGLDILREEGAQEIGGVFHCFSGDYDMARSCMDLGFSISIPGTITFNNSSKLRETIKKIPLDRILVETDCPYLTPMPFRGSRNEPAYVKFTALKLAEEAAKFHKPFYTKWYVVMPVGMAAATLIYYLMKKLRGK